MTELFPAPLSAFEQYLLFDNRASFPLDFFVNLEVEGTLDVVCLETAFREALKSHSLLAASVFRKGRRFFWRASDQEPSFESHQSDQSFEKTAIDIFSEPGVRMYVIRRPDCYELIFQFHHSATDGLGAFGLISDVLLKYAGEFDGTVQCPPRDVAKLADRYLCGYHSESVWSRVVKTTKGLLGTREFLGAKIAPVVAHEPNIDQPRNAADFPRYLSHEFTANETDALKRHAKSRGVSLNTLLICDAFIAVDRAKSRFECYRQDEYIRIAVPGNLRATRVNDGIPAANFFSMTFPVRNPSQIKDHDALLRSVHKEVQDGRKCFYFATFYLCLKVVRKLPGLLKRMVNVAHCQTTLLLTNLGRAISEFPRESADSPIKFGDAVVSQVEIVAPMRPYQSIAVSTLEYSGRQIVTLSYDPRVHSDADAEDLLKDFASQLQDRLVVAETSAVSVS